MQTLVLMTRNVKLTTRLCSVALFQGDVDLHDGDMLDLYLQPETGLEQDVKRWSLEYVDVSFKERDIWNLRNNHLMP